jgi:hypothetical protein
MGRPPKLNIQGMARRDKGLMSCLVSDPGYTYVSVDLSSGEPTVTSQYSRDPRYYAACFGMVGKDPYYDNGILMIDDIYLMCASASPMGKEAIRKCFDEGVFDGWNTGEKEDIQKKHPVIGPIRVFHKPLALGLGYSMGPRKMVTTARDHGHLITYKDAKAFHTAYWKEIYSDLGLYADKQQAILKSVGYLVNQFGYRLVPDSPHKAFNYMIQSSVSGIINLLDGIFEVLCHNADLDVTFITIIHDELIYRIADKDLADTQKMMDAAVVELNRILAWDVNIRTGWEEGKTLYEAK